jgi:hypothetical protein
MLFAEIFDTTERQNAPVGPKWIKAPGVKFEFWSLPKRTNVPTVKFDFVPLKQKILQWAPKMGKSLRSKT